MKKYLVEINVINKINGKNIYTRIAEATFDGETKEDVLDKISPYSDGKIIKKYKDNPFNCYYDFRYYVYRREYDEPIATIDVIELTD